MSRQAEEFVVADNDTGGHRSGYADKPCVLTRHVNAHQWLRSYSYAWIKSEISDTKFRKLRGGQCLLDLRYLQTLSSENYTLQGSLVFRGLGRTLWFEITPM